MGGRHLAVSCVLSVSMLFAAACGSNGGQSGDDSDSTAPPLGMGPYPIADLEIRYDHPERSLSYQIGCQGDTSSSGGDADEAGIDPNDACLALTDETLRDRLLDGPPDDRVCTQIFGGQDVATIEGTIDGEVIDATLDRSDGCAIAEWDGGAAPLLPLPYEDASGETTSTTT